MTDLQDLYQELIIGHNRRPRNRRRIESADQHADGYNPLCGDRVTVYLKIKDDVIEDVSFEGSGCAISTASASLMTEAVKGKSVDEAKEMFEIFHGLVTGEKQEVAPDPKLGKLKVFSGVSQYPARVKCATLVWHTLAAAVQGNDKVVTTEHPAD